MYIYHKAAFEKPKYCSRHLKTFRFQLILHICNIQTTNDCSLGIYKPLSDRQLGDVESNLEIYHDFFRSTIDPSAEGVGLYAFQTSNVA